MWKRWHCRRSPQYWRSYWIALYSQLGWTNREDNSTVYTLTINVYILILRTCVGVCDPSPISMQRCLAVCCLLCQYFQYLSWSSVSFSSPNTSITTLWNIQSALHYKHTPPRPKTQKQHLQRNTYTLFPKLYTEDKIEGNPETLGSPVRDDWEQPQLVKPGQTWPELSEDICQWP